MNILALSSAWIACLPVIAQDQATVPTVKEPQAVSFKIGGGIAPVFLPTKALVSFSALSVQRDASILRLKGNVEIKTDAGTLQADEVDYYWDSGEIKARGNVRKKPSLRIAEKWSVLPALR
jgi:lipopolysaccharide assembly outer membrane protein LptD (OstA)